MASCNPCRCTWIIVGRPHLDSLRRFPQGLRPSRPLTVGHPTHFSISANAIALPLLCCSGLTSALLLFRQRILLHGQHLLIGFLKTLPCHFLLAHQWHLHAFFVSALAVLFIASIPFPGCLAHPIILTRCTWQVLLISARGFSCFPPIATLAYG